MPTLSSLVTLHVVIMTTCSATSDNKVGIMTTPCFNSSPSRQNGRHFADDIFRCIFLNGNVSIWIKMSLNFVPKGSINNIPALVQIIAWHQIGDKPLSAPMLTRFTDSLTHICSTRGRWVNEWLCWNQHLKMSADILHYTTCLELTHCCLVMPYGDVELGQLWHGLLPNCTKPLPVPMLTYHQWVPVTITWEQFH